MAHYPTGVCVVTAVDVSGRQLALVVGSFTSVSLDPPLVGFLPMRRSQTWQAMAACERLVISVLACDQADICQQMARPGENQFDRIPIRHSPYAVPMIEGAILHISCRVANVCEAGDHWFVQCEVDDITINRTVEPLVFHRGRYCAATAIG